MSTPKRPIYEIADEIEAEWVKVNYAARPYLDAMKDLNSAEENYGADSGRSIVLYFLSNARSFRGEAAKRLKAELKAVLA